MKTRFLPATLLCSTALVWACGSNPTVEGGDGNSGGSGEGGDRSGGDGDGITVGDGDGNGSGSGGTSGDGDGDGDGDLNVPDWNYPDDVDFPYTPIEGGGDTCGSVTGEPQSVSRPIDIIFVIDNSSSMNNEIKEVEQNIKVNFADIIEASGIDYRVIMISRYGNSNGSVIGGADFQVCIPDTSLGATACTDPHVEPLSNNAPTFYHYSADIESKDSLCVLLESFDEPDEFDDQDTTNDGDPGDVYRSWTTLAPNGWMEWLREDAFKTFVMITDDDVDCLTNDFSSWVIDQDHAGISFDDEDPSDRDAAGLSVANTFDARLLAMSPTQFGTAMDRNYVWHSIIGLEENDPVDLPWGPDDPIQLTTCDTGSSGSGTSYQHLSKLTGGLRFPICPQGGITNFDPIFDEIAQGVIDSAAIPCEYDFPDVEGIINVDNIVVNYTPSGSGTAETYALSSDGCTSGDYYFDDDEKPTQLFLCANTCDAVQADGGDLQLDFGCLGS